MQRCFSNLLSDDVNQTASFYENLLGMRRHFDSDWFVILTHEGIDDLELGVLEREHAIVPEQARTPAGGMILTFVVDDCDAIHQKAKALNTPILQPPTDMPYGQRRMLLRDPDGTVVDVSAPTAPVVDAT